MHAEQPVDRANSTSLGHKRSKPDRRIRVAEGHVTPGQGYAKRGGRPVTWIGGGGQDPKLLSQLGVPKLRELFLAVFGEPTASNNAAWLRRKLAERPDTIFGQGRCEHVRKRDAGAAIWADGDHIVGFGGASAGGGGGDSSADSGAAESGSEYIGCDDGGAEGDAGLLSCALSWPQAACGITAAGDAPHKRAPPRRCGSQMSVGYYGGGAAVGAAGLAAALPAAPGPLQQLPGGCGERVPLHWDKGGSSLSVGSCVQVYWPEDDTWWAATVLHCDFVGRHLQLLYSNLQEESITGDDFEGLVRKGHLATLLPDFGRCAKRARTLPQGAAAELPAPLRVASAPAQLLPQVIKREQPEASAPGAASGPASQLQPWWAAAPQAATLQLPTQVPQQPLAPPCGKALAVETVPTKSSSSGGSHSDDTCLPIFQCFEAWQAQIQLQQRLAQMGCPQQQQQHQHHQQQQDLQLQMQQQLANSAGWGFAAASQPAASAAVAAASAGMAGASFLWEQAAAAAAACTAAGGYPLAPGRAGGGAPAGLHLQSLPVAAAISAAGPEAGRVVLEGLCAPKSPTPAAPQQPPSPPAAAAPLPLSPPPGPLSPAADGAGGAAEDAVGDDGRDAEEEAAAWLLEDALASPDARGASDGADGLELGAAAGAAGAAAGAAGGGLGGGDSLGRCGSGPLDDVEIDVLDEGMRSLVHDVELEGLEVAAAAAAAAAAGGGGPGACGGAGGGGTGSPVGGPVCFGVPGSGPLGCRELLGGVDLEEGGLFCYLEGF